MSEIVKQEAWSTRGGETAYLDDKPPNMSELEWITHPSNPCGLLNAMVLASYRRMGMLFAREGENALDE